jgi:hypothetical protein
MGSKPQARKNANASEERLEFTQDFIPVKDIRHGIIETTDHRYIKILEIEPINFMLRSDEEQFGIISSFASWLKISPARLQFKSITRKADSDRHINMIREELAQENNPACKRQGEEYIRFIKEIGSREALTRRFFLIFQYEEIRKGDSSDYAQVLGTMQTIEQNARAYFLQCGNTIVQPSDPDEAAAEILYQFFNRRSCVDEPFTSRVDRVVLDTMAGKKLVLGVDSVPHIRMAHFIAPRGIDLRHSGYVVMDGLYYAFLYIRANGYPSRVRGGWMSSLVNAGEGVDIDVFLRRENRSKAIDKVAQRIRLNRTKLKGMQDTSTDYEELANSIQSGYFIKNGIANYNEDLFYLSVFITVSARSYEELMWRKGQMSDMLKSMDMYVSDCRFQMEKALKTVMPFLSIDPGLEKKSQRNVLTSGAASTYMFTSFEMSDDSGVLLGVNRHNNSLCIVDLFNTRKNKNANLNLIGTSGAGKTFTLQLLALRMRMRGIAVTQWLSERLKLEVSPEKTRIVNVKRRHSNFLGFKLRVYPRGKKFVVSSHISDKQLSNKRQALIAQAKNVANPRPGKSEYDEISLYNSMVMGMQNYYCIATNVSRDCSKLGRAVMIVFKNRLREQRKSRLVKQGRKLSRVEREKYGDTATLRYLAGSREPIYPISYVQHKPPHSMKRGICNYTPEGRTVTVIEFQTAT